MRVVFIGTGEIGLPVLRSLRQSGEHELIGVVTQPDKPVGREQRIQAPPIKAALIGLRIPVLQPERIKREEAFSSLRDLAPDVIVVMAYGQILPRAVLEIPKIACLNLHASLLPKFRGAAPIQAAILAGETETGITVMYMDEGLDTGDLLLEKRVEIAPNETGGSLHDQLAEAAPPALHEALSKLANGTAPRATQDASEASYAPKLQREDGELDWREPAEMIERKIRAFNPWPTAYTMIPDETGRLRKLKIFTATVRLGNSAAAGKIISEGMNDLAFGASDGAVLPGEVQLEGKKRMSAIDFRRGFKSHVS